jgi:hypothetical protein
MKQLLYISSILLIANNYTLAMEPNPQPPSLEKSFSTLQISTNYSAEGQMLGKKILDAYKARLRKDDTTALDQEIHARFQHILLTIFNTNTNTTDQVRYLTHFFSALKETLEAAPSHDPLFNEYYLFYRFAALDVLKPSSSNISSFSAHKQQEKKYGLATDRIKQMMPHLKLCFNLSVLAEFDCLTTINRALALAFVANRLDVLAFESAGTEAGICLIEGLNAQASEDFQSCSQQCFEFKKRLFLCIQHLIPLFVVDDYLSQEYQKTLTYLRTFIQSIFDTLQQTDTTIIAFSESALKKYTQYKVIFGDILYNELSAEQVKKQFKELLLVLTNDLLENYIQAQQ